MAEPCQVWSRTASRKLPQMDTPRQKKNLGGQKTTWCRTLRQELEQINLSQGEAHHAAMVRMQQRVLIEALCPIGDEEEY